MRTLGGIASVLMLVGLAQAQATPDAPRQIRIHKLTIESKALPAADRDQIARQFEGKTYSTETLAAFEEEMSERIRDSLQVLAYFKALVTNLGVSLLNGKNQQAGAVDIAAGVDEGLRYYLGEISFKNATVFPSEQLREAFAMQRGEVFNTDKMREGIQNLRKLYAAKGHINFTPVPDTNIDDTRQIVDVTFDLDEGPVFYFGALVLDGLEPEDVAAKTLSESWVRLQGKPYDADALEQWFFENTSDLRGAAPEYAWKSMETSPEPESHIVTVRFWFP